MLSCPALHAHSRDLERLSIHEGNDWLEQTIQAPTPWSQNIKWSVTIIPGLVWYFLFSLKVPKATSMEGQINIRGVIKKFVDCLYKIKTP